MSAPCSIGRVSTGVAEVLSTPSTAPARWAMSATAAMSVTCQLGLAGVSIHTTLRLPGPHGRGEGVQVGRVHEVDRDAPGLQQLEQPCAQRPVHLLGRHHMVAGLEGLEHAS